MPQFALEEFVHGLIAGADRAAAMLFPNRRVMAVPRPCPERDLAGLADNRFQALAVNQATAFALFKNDSQLAFIFLPWKGFEAFSRPLACA